MVTRTSYQLIVVSVVPDVRGLLTVGTTTLLTVSVSFRVFFRREGRRARVVHRRRQPLGICKESVGTREIGVHPDSVTSVVTSTGTLPVETLHRLLLTGPLSSRTYPRLTCVVLDLFITRLFLRGFPNNNWFVTHGVYVFPGSVVRDLPLNSDVSHFRPRLDFVDLNMVFTARLILDFQLVGSTEGLGNFP